MRKLSKLFIVVIVIAMLITGCQPAKGPGDKDTNPTSGESEPVLTPTETEQVVDAANGLSYVGLIIPQMNSEWWVTLAREISEPLEAVGIKVEVEASGNDHARQLELVENFANKGIDGLILFPIGASDIGGTLENLQSQGIRTVIFLNGVESGYDAMLLTNHEEVGLSVARMAAEWIDETFPDAEPGSIEVGMITTMMSPESQLQCEAMKEVENLTDKAKIVISYDLSHDDPDTKAQDSMEMAFGSYPNLKCMLVYAANKATAIDEVVMRTPGVDPAQFGIFTDTYGSEAGKRISMSRENLSTVRGVNVNGEGDWGYVADAMLGKLPLNEENIYYDVVTDITAANIDQFYQD